jgi:hypothetical protein
VDWRWFWLNLSVAFPAFFLVMVVGAAEEGYLVEHVLLEPFEPKINNWRDE